ncbi:MAG: hypothetical protein IPL80_19780 [Sterolibacteriaceae bacterium]|mgnify:CR=1 FL=1|nr:hypothetical protein [Sterolibacteriaceae bacterium]
MTTIPRPVAEALATAAEQLRKHQAHTIGCTPWDRPGIIAAITQASRIAAPADIAIALMRVTANPHARTPMLLPSPGAHWESTTTAARPAPTMCGRHPSNRAAGCRECEHENIGDPIAGAASVRDSLRNAPKLPNPDSVRERQERHRAAVKGRS